MEEPTRFFMVHNPKRGIPSVRHELLNGAVAEAERLAEKHPGDLIYVLETVNSFIAETPKARQVGVVIGF